jgi:hypothetical protein
MVTALGRWETLFLVAGGLSYADLLGSSEWRRTCSEELGPDKFFEMMVSSENPMLAFLRRKHTLSELKELVLAPLVLYNCAGAAPFIEQLVCSKSLLPYTTR